MDNKLSELSKPVGYFIEWKDEETGEKEWCECSKQNGAPLYSQEYVSALLAELEAKDEQNKLLMREIEHGKKLRVNMQNNADSLSERIAELEAEVKVWESAALKHLSRAEEAEKRLATPVRLPNKNDDEFWFDGVFQVAKFDRAVERAISAAGFKVEGEQ